jgi:trimeric autotransporter adhesin
MRLLPAVLLASTVSCAAFGQSYSISTIAGALPVNIPGTSASLRGVNQVAIDPAGNVFIADIEYDIVLRLDAKTRVLTLVAGNGTAGFSGDGGPAISAYLNQPYGVAVDSARNLYIADSANNSIRKVSSGVITTIAGNGTAGFSGDNGPATSAQLNFPEGVAVDSADNLYIADANNNRIRRVSKGLITTVAGGGTSGLGDGRPATSAQFRAPKGVAVDSAGNLYIADTGNAHIRKASNGVITTMAGNDWLSFSGDNGPAARAQLYLPYSAAVDSAGNLYIADTNNRRIRKVSNGVITTMAGGGTQLGDNGPAAAAQLFSPFGIAVDSAGNLYIADYSNNRIRKVSNSVITTVAGNGTPGFSGDNGPATRAELNEPASVTVDGAGNLYIADRTNQRIRKVSNGVITTVAGNGTAGFSGDNGPAASAQLNQRPI